MRPLAAGAFFPFDADRLDLRGQWENDDGVDVSTLREYGAKFGGGVAVEPGITNQQTQVQFETLLGGYNVTNGHRPQDVTNQFGGWRRVPKVSGVGNTNDEVYVNGGFAASPGQRYTQQVLFRFDGTRPSFNFSFYTNNGHHVVAATITDLGGGVWHAMAVYDIEASVTAVSYCIYLVNLAWATSTYIELLDPVIHLHSGVHAAIAAPVRTSHVWGTRAAGLLKYPGWLLPRASGTISFWIRPNYDFNGVSLQHYLIVGRSSPATPYNESVLLIGTGGSPPSAALRFVVSLNGVVTLNLGSVALTWSPALLYHVACTWGDAEQVLYVNGARVAALSGNFTRWPEGTWVGVGSSVAPASVGLWADCLFDDLAIIPRQLTDAQVAAIYSA